MQVLPRQAGSREPRHGHLLSGPLDAAAESQAAAPAPSPGARSGAESQRIAELERALAQLRSEFEDFRRRFE